MRITFGSQYANYVKDLARTESQMAESSRVLTTGKKINTLGDDPIGVASSLRMKRLLAGIEQYDKNLHAAKGQLGYAENALAEVQTLMRRAYELSVSAANSTTSQEGRVAMAAEVSEIQKRIMDLGNTMGPNGSYLFAGQQTTTKPFTIDASGLLYNGDDANTLVEISPNTTMAINTQGRQLFMDAYASLTNLKNSLEGGNLAELGGPVLESLQAQDKAVGNVRATIGAKIKTVEEQSTNHTRRKDELTELISNVEDADMSEAIVRYTQAQTAYQAALQTISMSSQLSLVDFLR
jgi:flagellar hook-associated protein 3 FlgL